jgi:hypothetical protein
MMADVERIRQFLMNVNPYNPKHRDAVLRGLGILVSNQTADERAAKVTNHHNNRGFNGRDAYFGTDVYQKANQYGGLTIGQTKAVAKMLVKYARQIAEAT